MSKFRKYVLLLAVGILALVLVWAFFYEREPRYKGRSLSEWIHLNWDYDPEATNALPAGTETPPDAIRHIGTNAMPHLLEWMAYEQTENWRYKLHRARQWPEWLEEIIWPHEFVHGEEPASRRASEAEHAFELLGPMAAPALPELLHRGGLTNAPMTRRRAINCLGTNAYPLVPQLVQMLRDKNCYAVMEAVDFLGRLKPDPELEVPALAECLTNLNASVRIRAAFALKQYGALARPAVPALVAASQTPIQPFASSLPTHSKTSRPKSSPTHLHNNFAPSALRCGK